MVVGKVSRDPWGVVRPELSRGMLIRYPDKRAFVVGYVNYSRARIYPLTTTTRTVTRIKKLGAKHTEKVETVVEEIGEPFDISPNSGLPVVELADLTDDEYRRLEYFVSTGGYFPGLE